MLGMEFFGLECHYMFVMGNRLNRRRTFTLAVAIALTGIACAATTPLTNALWVDSVSSLPNAVTDSAARDAHPKQRSERCEHGVR